MRTLLEGPAVIATHRPTKPATTTVTPRLDTASPDLVRADRAALASTLTYMDKRYREAAHRADEHEDAIAALQREVMAARRDCAQQQLATASAKSATDLWRTQVSKLNADLKLAHERLQDSAAAVTALTSQLREATDKVTSLTASRDQLTARYEAARSTTLEEVRSLQRQLDATREELTTTKAEVAMLRSVVHPPLDVAIRAAQLQSPDVVVTRDTYGDRMRLGSGAQADVYAAALQCVVKVPKLPSGCEAHSDSTVAAFWQEVAFHQPLCHPHIVAVHGGCAVVEASSGRTKELRMVMERCSGGTLESRLHSSGAGSHPASVRQRLTWAYQTMSALEHLHARDIIHADVKPENVLLEDGSPGARAKLSDFGMSKQRGEGTSTHASHLGLRGSYLYMDVRLLAGEATRGGFTVAAAAAGDRGAIRKASDVYSAGVLLWECAMGRRPYADALGGGNFSLVTLAALVTFVLDKGRPATPEQLASMSPPGLGALIGRMWSGRAEERPSMAGAVEELGRLMAGLE